MKKTLLLLLMVIIGITALYAQKIPNGIKYQAVARSASGEILSNHSITLRISLKASPAKGSQIFYSEDHLVTTNQFGLFDIVVGEGKNNMGVFAAIPWSSEDVWLAVALKDKGTDFSAVTESRLLAVPYAFHALTASRLVDYSSIGKTDNLNLITANAGNGNFPGVPANVWSLQGNYRSDPLTDKLGTTDIVDLVMVTSNTERLRIKANGDITIKRSLAIGANLTVDSSVYLNKVSGSTINYGPFKVDRLSPTLLSGTLTVDGASVLNSSLTVNGPTDLNSRLFVNNLSPTKLTGTLNVIGITDLDSALNVNKGNPTLLTGTLKVVKAALFKDTVLIDNNRVSDSTTTGALVIKGGLGLGGNLNVGGASTFGGSVKFKAPVSITDGTESTNTTTGALIVTGGIGAGKNLNVGGTLAVAGITSLTNVTQSTASTNGALVVSGGAGIIKNLNVGGTLTSTGVATINNTLNVNGSGDYIANFVNSTDANGISIKIGTPESRNANHFLTFIDGNNNVVGRIQGENIGELVSNTDYQVAIKSLDLAVAGAAISVATGAINVIRAGGALIGAAASSTACVGLGVCVTTPIPSLIISAGVDLALAIADEVSVAIGLADAVTQRNYFESNSKANIGVTYQSGSGDYAEWLPKANTTEKFIPGYIVGMKNGHISLTVENADKLFVISTKPILLGNMPVAGKESEYEKVAFMGQVPVHVLGKVNMGDYILPSGDNNGFGRAVSPAKMKTDDYDKIVGMAWSASTNDTYSQVNVAIGLNTGDISKVVAVQHKEIDELKQKISETNTLLAKLVPGYKEAAGLKNDIVTPMSKPIISNNIVQSSYLTPDASNIIYFEITDQQQITMMDEAKKLFLERGGNENTDPFWKRMKNDPAFKNSMMAKMKDKISKSLHTHKDINSHPPIDK